MSRATPTREALLRWQQDERTYSENNHQQALDDLAEQRATTRATIEAGGFPAKFLVSHDAETDRQLAELRSTNERLTRVMLDRHQHELATRRPTREELT